MALSQEEIDRLVAEIDAGNIDIAEYEDAPRDQTFQTYDFQRPTGIAKGQLRSIRNLHETFAETYGFHLASRLQTMCTVKMLVVDQLRYSEYVLSVSNPCVVYIFDVEQTGGRALLEMSPEMVFTIVERMLGGQGGGQSSSRTITVIEQRIIEPLVLKALSILTVAWKPVTELKLTLANFENNSDFVQIAPASETVVVISLEVTIAEDTFLMNICYPTLAIEDLITGASAVSYRDNNSTKEAVKAKRNISTHLHKTAVTVKAILGKTEISLRELLELRAGDILNLERSIQDDIPIYVADRIKFLGRPGTHDGRLAVKITVDDQEDLHREE